MFSGILGNLPAEVQAQLQGAGRLGRWNKGELLFHSADPVETLIILLTGSVRLYQLGQNAREITLDVHGAGDLLGVRALRGESLASTYGLYAEALEDTEALLIGPETLARLRRQYLTLDLALSQQLIAQTQNVQTRLSQLVFLEVSQRLALALLHLAKDGHWNEDGLLALRERISHQDLAYAVGSTRETITKLLGDFRNRGLLDLGYRRLVLTDYAGLLQATREPLR